MVKYKEFKIKELFDVTSTKKKFNANTIKFGGEYPYVARSSVNNGIRGYISEDKKYLNEANTISFGQDTATMFYQEKPYFTGDKIKIMTFKERNLNRKLACYLITTMKKAFQNFAWGQSSFNESILKNIKIELPINNDNKIDFQYMEDYISELEEERISELEEERISELTAYLTVSGLENYGLTDDEKELLNKKVNYKEFKIGDLFYITTGRDVIINTLEHGKIPLISHQHDNNGITKYIKQLNNRKIFNYKDTIALADRGVFYATTQNTNFHIGTRVKALTFKSGEQNEKIRLFFVASINKLQILFKDYLTNATDKLPNLLIKLPVTINNEINYDYMEKYITIQQKLAIKSVVDWKDKQITTTKQVVKNK